MINQINVIGEYSLYISFPYNQDIIDIIRKQTIKYWLPMKRAWEIPLKKFDDITQQLSHYELNIIDTKNLLSNLKVNRRCNKLHS